MCHSYFFNTFIEVTPKTDAGYSSETSVHIYDTKRLNNQETIICVLCN
jgi:hypothetical protein